MAEDTTQQTIDPIRSAIREELGNIVGRLGDVEMIPADEMRALLADSHADVRTFIKNSPLDAAVFAAAVAGPAFLAGVAAAGWFGFGG